MEHVTFLEMDVTNSASVTAAARAAAQAGGVDVLVCNAAIAYLFQKNTPQMVGRKARPPPALCSCFPFVAGQAADTLETNYFGVRRCLDAFQAEGAVTNAGRCIVLSSRMGDSGKLASHMI